MSQRGELRNLLILCLGGLTLLTAGCGSDAKHKVPAPVATRPLVSLPHYSNAAAERNKLLALARPGTKISSQGNLSDWPPANGSAIPATATEISGFGFNMDRAKKAQYLSFAVTDTSGACAGGEILAKANGTTVVSASPVKLPSHAPCTGDEVAKLAGHG